MSLAEDVQKIRDAESLTAAEKIYIFDIELAMGGSFTKALFDAIARADSWNRQRLALGFPEEVAAYRAWTEGDLYDRVFSILGPNASVVL